jgi:arylsulfatase A-like enzyme
MARPKSILLIVADQWRAECLSRLGHPVVQTPHLDALAAEGVLFRNHFAQCTMCGPSRASLFTGMYLQNHRSVTNGSPLDARHTNLALEMRKLGYDPTLIGYTDTSPDPRLYDPSDPVLTTYEGVLPGFTSLLGKIVDGSPLAWLHWLKERGYDVPKNPIEMFRPLPDYPGADERGVTFAPPRYTKDESDTAFQTEHALKFIRAQGDEPWFLHMSYCRPHPPYSVPEPYNRMYHPDQVPDFRRASTPDEEARQHPFLAYLLERNPKDRNWGAHTYLRDDRSMRQLRATYYGLMTEVDHHIGRMIACLKETRQYEDTLIVFVSDHGEQLWDHWMIGKGPHFDQCFHVPLIVRAPGCDMNPGRGSSIDCFTENIDIMPTLIDLFDRQIPLQCDGLSLRPFLEGRKPERWRTEAHWEIDFRDVESGQPEKALGIRLHECNLAVIRDEWYKYVHFAALPPLFYDLRKDSDELHNLAGDPVYAGLVLTYAQKMISWRMVNDERTLTGKKVGPGGVMERPRSEW